MALISFAFTTAVRMVVRVHYGTSYGRADSHMSLSAGFTDLDIGVVEIAYFADGCSASHAHFSYFSGRKSYLSVISFFGHELSAVSG